MPAILRISASHTSGAPNIIALVLRVLLGGTALDEVRRDRERRAREADQRRAAELAHQAADRLGDEGDVVGVEVGDRLDVGQGAHRLRRRPARRRA